MLDQVAIYDDLIDKDKPITDGDIHRAFWLANVEMPRNPFYRAHFDVLNPLVMAAITSWRAANDMERDKLEDDLPVSFVIRSAYCDIVVMCVLILFGPDAAANAALSIRRFVHDEGLGSYLKEMRGK